MSIPEINRMSRLQYTIIFICFLMNMCDGMDIMAVSYSAKAISTEWLVTPKNFGVVFSSGLFGMALGAFILAPFADKAGRKALIIISLIIMGITSLLTSLVDSLSMLILVRLCTGIGVGCLLACVNVLTAEYSSSKMRSFWVSFVGSGYPAGAMLSGLFVDFVISEHGWRALFLVVGALTLLVVPLAAVFIKESFEFLADKQPVNALSRINKIFRAMQVPEMTALPTKNQQQKKASVPALFQSGLNQYTLFLWICYFFCFGAFYFLTSWIPKLASDFGMTDSLAIYAGLVFNLGSLLGIISQGFLSTKFGLKRVISVFLICSGILMTLFGLFNSSALMLCLFACIGFVIQGGLVGLYAVSANLYPAIIRSTGIGWATGLGRVGAIIGPFVGGLLISLGISTQLNLIIFAVPCVIAGLFILLIRLK